MILCPAVKPVPKQIGRRVGEVPRRFLPHVVHMQVTALRQ